MKKLFTSESVTEGHPDKLCDYISDSILDSYLEKDKNARVACETVAGKGEILVTGEITSKAEGIDVEKIVRNAIKEIGYDNADLDIDFSKADSIKITEYTEGNRVKNLKVGNLNLSGVEIRNIFGLRSANFKIDIQENNVKFAVIGYGHGVGMSQTGADSLAKQGKKYDEIIKHYYTGVEIKNM